MSGHGLVEEDILYEDDFIIVCRKRAGMATQTSRLGEQDLESALKNYWKTPYVAVIHRLDQPVEGILVFARTKEAAAVLSRQSTGQVMNKKYYAVVMMDASRGDSLDEDVSGDGFLLNEADEGSPFMEDASKMGSFSENCNAKEFFMPSGEANILVDYLQKNGRENISRVVSKGTKDGKRAELAYEVLAIKEATERDRAIRKQIALLRVRLKTGRHHQIRVQMANAGMPLLGDGKYGSIESKDYSRRIGINNIALCACSLEFLHPVTGKKMNFEITPKGNGFCSFFPVNS